MTTKMKPKPSIREFLDGGAADVADRSIQEPVSAPAIQAKIPREQKVFRLPLNLIQDLKREAYERSMASGSRVTETELVEQALRVFFAR